MTERVAENSLDGRAGRFRSRLECFRERLAGQWSEDDAGFIPAMEDFLRFIAQYDDKDAYAAFERRGPLREFRSFFADCVLRFAWVMEGRTYSELASKMTAGGKIGPRLGRSTWGSYARMGDAVKLVDFSSCRRLVVMGCGRAPCSLFYLHDWTDVPCLVGIDRDPESLTMSRQLAEGFGLDRIRIVGADAADLDYSEFDIIYWGPFAQPRHKIMERLATTGRPGSVVILRDPFFTGTLLFEPMVPALDPRLAICAESSGYPGRFMLKHYVLRLTTAPSPPPKHDDGPRQAPIACC